MSESGVIQIPVLFDMSGDTVVFGEEATGDFVSSHLDFVLDMTTEANDISLNAADISSAILIGDQDTGDNIFYAGGTSGNVAVDELCNRIAKAITRGKLVHIPKSGNHSNSGIPMGGRNYLVDTNGINQENTNFDKYAIKYIASIAPIGDEQMLGQAMARVASIHLVGSPLSAGIFQDKNQVQTDLETASGQTFNSGATAFYNSLAVQLSKVLGGSKSTTPMKNAKVTTDEFVMGPDASGIFYENFETAGTGTGNGVRSTDYAKSGTYSLTKSNTLPYYQVNSTTTPSMSYDRIRAVSLALRGKDGETIINSNNEHTIWSLVKDGGGFRMADYFDKIFTEDFETAYTGTDFNDFARNSTIKRHNSYSGHRSGAIGGYSFTAFSNTLILDGGSSSISDMVYQDAACNGAGTKIIAVCNNRKNWMSTDSGANWTELTSLPVKNFKQCQMSTDGTKIAVCGYGGAGIYVSTDGGTTFTQYETDKQWYSIAMSDDGTTLVAGDYGNSGSGRASCLYRSTDSGATWTKLTDTEHGQVGQEKWVDKCIACSSDGTKFVAVSNSDYIWYSHDSGATWTSNTTMGTAQWDACAMSKNGTYVVTQNKSTGNVWVSSDSGVNWTEKTTNITANYNLMDVAISEDGQKILAAAFYWGIQVSIDGGANWTKAIDSAGQNNGWRSVTLTDDASVAYATAGYQNAVFKATLSPAGGNFYHVTTSTTPALTSGLTNVMGLGFQLHTSDNHGTDDKVLLHAFNEKGTANEWEFKLYIRGDATASNRKLAFYAKYQGTLTNNTPDTIFVKNAEYSKDTTLTSGNIAVYNVGPSVFANGDWVGIFLRLNGRAIDEVYLLGDKDDTDTARSTTTTYIDYFNIYHSTNATIISNDSILTGSDKILDAGSGSTTGNQVRAYFKAAGNASDRRLSIVNNMVEPTGALTTLPDNILKVLWDGVEKTPVNDSNSQNTTGIKEYDVLSSALEDGQWHNLTVALSGSPITDFYLLANHRNEDSSTLNFVYADDLKLINNDNQNLTDAQLTSVAAGGNGAAPIATGGFVHGFDASGVSNPALKSIYEQLMNVPGRSQIMETRDVSGVRDNSNVTLAGGFPFIAGDKLVMYLRPKIVFATQTHPEQFTTLLGFPDSMTLNVPAYWLTRYASNQWTYLTGTPAFAQQSGQINGDKGWWSAVQQGFTDKLWNSGGHVRAKQAYVDANGNTIRAGTILSQVAHTMSDGSTLSGHWVETDFGEEVILTKYSLQNQTYDMNGWRMPTGFHVIGSLTDVDENGPWELIGTHDPNTGPATEIYGSSYISKYTSVQGDGPYYIANGVYDGHWLISFHDAHYIRLTFPAANLKPYRYVRFLFYNSHGVDHYSNSNRMLSVGPVLFYGVRNVSSEVTAGSGAGDPATQAAAAGVDISGLVTNFSNTPQNISDAFPGNATGGNESELEKWGWMGSANSDTLSLETTDIQDTNTIDLHIWKITITL